jgi:hypothetical protein
MRKFIITFVIILALAAGTSVLWLLEARQVSMFVDRYRTIQSDSTPIRSLTYEGTGTGGALLVNDLHLNLDPVDSQVASPHIGTTKEDQVALSFGRKVFPFGLVQATPAGSDGVLATALQPTDEASISIRHSAISWMEPFNLNFMTGQSPSRKRHIYYEMVWKKPSGAKLEMLWRYEQHFLPGNGWGGGFMTHEGETGLIRVEISGTTP